MMLRHHGPDQYGASDSSLTRKEPILPYLQSGEIIDSRISSALLQNIFSKTSSPDGATIIVGSKILAAKCVLPLTKKIDLPMGLGMRHRSALGMTEDTDTLVIVVSEQTGDISYCLRGELNKITSEKELELIINQHQDKK